MKHLREICAGLLVGSTLLLFTGCETRVQAEAGYDYDYYPAHRVYYYPQTRVYYWNDSGRWRSGRNLPTHIDIHEESHQTVHTHTRQPWNEHHDDDHNRDSDHDHH